MRVLEVWRAPLAGLGAATVLFAPPAEACTICHSPTSLGVRHLLLEHDPVRNAAAIASPLPLLLAAILLAANAPRRRRDRAP